MDYFAAHSGAYESCVLDAARVLKPWMPSRLKGLIQTGSGFEVNQIPSIKRACSIPLVQVPHFPRPSVEGHSGMLHVFESRGGGVAVLEGRYHSYENRSAWEIVFPIRVIACFKPEWVLFTNAAGAINSEMSPGDLVMITNHLNHLVMNPLRGLDERIFGSRFVSMDHPYDLELTRKAMEIFKTLKLNRQIHRGVYIAVPGPSFETEAEIKAFEILGADLVGMSTVLEVVAARALNLPVIACSLVTNYACGKAPGKVHHRETLDMAKKFKTDFLALMLALMRSL
jgi:purine-nucleoside phosphorylase